jgi:WD40 repeat protein
MKTTCLLILLFSAGVVDAQKTKWAPAHTRDVLAVKFSPDDTQLLSYSGGDGWLILWEVRSGYLIWRAKTELVQRATERSNLQEFFWSQDGQFINEERKWNLPKLGCAYGKTGRSL